MENKEWNDCTDDYHSIIISPLKPNVKNPIFSDMRAIAQKNIVADLGTGRGDFLPFLSKNFKFVYALDFSENMLDAAKARNKWKNIKFIRHDIRQLSKLGLKLDVAVAINSILHPSFEDVNRSLSEIHDSLKDGGLFIGIFPSMEAMLYHFMLVYEREFEKYKDESKAMTMTRRKVERKKYNMIRGIYDDDGEQQKFFYKVELKERLKTAGFKNIAVKKVKYPWGETCGDYEDFPGRRMLWDWYVICKK